MRERPVIAVANRLPVQQGDDGWELSPGGLVTALRPVMATHPGAWVGWDGGSKGVPQTFPDSGIRLIPIGLSAALVRDYYRGFSNATLWPLLHDAIEKPRFERAWWRAYQEVNRLFAERAMSALDGQPDAIAWVHDYQLMLVPQLLRDRHADQPIGFFLHVPWPSPVIYARLPWREQVLRGLLGADVVGFHTDEYRGNFLRSCARQLSDSGIEVRGSSVVLPDGRAVATVTAPISIDVAQFAASAADPAVKDDITALEEQFNGRTLLLGADRLDYTKGIIERLLAVEMLLSGARTCVPASRSCRSPCRAGTTCASTASCGAPWSSTSGGSTAGSPSRATTCRCITCTGGCRSSSWPRTTRSPTGCSSRR